MRDLLYKGASNEEMTNPYYFSEHIHGNCFCSHSSPLKCKFAASTQSTSDICLGLLLDLGDSPSVLSVTFSVKSSLKSQIIIMRKQASKFDSYH